MIRKLLPFVTVLIAALGGMAAGSVLRPAEIGSGTDGAPDAALHGGEDSAKDMAASGAAESEAKAYFRFPTQFFIPVMHGDRLDGMMVLSLTVEMPEGHEEDIYAQEFRLRDAFLRSLLIHANTGGFDGNYTIEPRMRRLREALMNTAFEIAGEKITDVLIEDIARQASS